CTEDYVIQSMPDVSPPKWHLGHTTWFFERMILEEFADNYRACHPRYYFVFNSYYQSFGERVARDIRGTLSRPTVEEVFAYRTEVDEKLVGLIGGLEQGRFAEFADLRGWTRGVLPSLLMWSSWGCTTNSSTRSCW
ncbi:MAG: DinB family protein, partial [Acidobacteria bacterium]|nr:DinB family protein [Acidobacteriota bacterium]